MNRPLLATTLINSVLQHWEVGRAEDLSVPPRRDGLMMVS